MFICFVSVMFMRRYERGGGDQPSSSGAYSIITSFLHAISLALELVFLWLWFTAARTPALLLQAVLTTVVVTYKK